MDQPVHRTRYSLCLLPLGPVHQRWAHLERKLIWNGNGTGTGTEKNQFPFLQFPFPFRIRSRLLAESRWFKLLYST